MGVLGEKVAIVTGGAQGIGKGISRALAREGARIVIADLDKEMAIGTAGEIEDLGVACVPVVGDVGLESTAEEACRVAETFGRLDILVNCAAGDGLRGAL